MATGRALAGLVASAASAAAAAAVGSAGSVGAERRSWGAPGRGYGVGGGVDGGKLGGRRTPTWGPTWLAGAGSGPRPLFPPSVPPPLSPRPRVRPVGSAPSRFAPPPAGRPRPAPPRPPPLRCCSRLPRSPGGRSGGPCRGSAASERASERGHRPCPRLFLPWISRRRHLARSRRARALRCGPVRPAARRVRRARSGRVPRGAPNCTCGERWAALGEEGGTGPAPRVGGPAELRSPA